MYDDKDRNMESWTKRSTGRCASVIVTMGEHVCLAGLVWLVGWLWTAAAAADCFVYFAWFYSLSIIIRLDLIHMGLDILSMAIWQLINAVRATKNTTFGPGRSDDELNIRRPTINLCAAFSMALDWLAYIQFRNF